MACTPPRGQKGSTGQIVVPRCQDVGVDTRTGPRLPDLDHLCRGSRALRFNAELAAAYEPLLTSRSYDPELKVPANKVGIAAGCR